VGQVVVHVVPRARVSGVTGIHGDAVKIRIAAPPLDGAANGELVRVLAQCLGVAPTRVVVTRGGARRRKQVHVAGLADIEIKRRLLAAVPETFPVTRPVRHAP
jgi:uncharacterized protein